MNKEILKTKSKIYFRDCYKLFDKFYIFREDCMRRIQTLLREEEFEQAIGVLRAARFVILTSLKNPQQRNHHFIILTH